MNPRLLPFAAVAIAAACQSARSSPLVDTSRPSRAFRFVYAASLPEVPAGSSDVKLWVPVPEDTSDQAIRDIHVTVVSGRRTVELRGDDLGYRSDDPGDPFTVTTNEIEKGLGRSLCVESHGKPIDVTVSFDVVRFETDGGGSARATELAEAKGPDALIPLGGKVSEVSESIETSVDTIEAARELYEHTLERMNYDKPDGGAWGRGDSEWACDSRFGNCTDFHSYFMGLARTKKIPARFEMGFSVPSGEEAEVEVKGYHCWAYFWANDRGWVPVDISEADRHPEKAEYFFGHLDFDRVTMTGGRDILLDPAPAAGTLNFFVYPYAEIDGVDASKQVKRTFKRVKV
jgi:hypothetical protein